MKVQEKKCGSNEALIPLEEKIRASQEPACGSYFTGRQKSKGYKIEWYEPWVKNLLNYSGDSTTPRWESQPGLAGNVTGPKWPVTHDGANVAGGDEGTNNVR